MHENVLIVISEEIDQLVTIHHEAINRLEDLRSALYKDWLGSERLGAVIEPEKWKSLPRVDRDMFSVRFEGKCCVLGNTLSFKLLARLLQRPNVYLSHDHLLEDVWDCVRTPEAIRSVVKTLRSKLRESQLESLADCIDGSRKGHYAIVLRQS